MSQDCVIKAKEGYTITDINGYPISDELTYYSTFYSNKYGNVIGPWLAYHVLKLTSQYNDTSCLRVADTQDNFEVLVYNKVNGCCASFDTILSHSSGKKFMVGFNWGH
jgi:hypothetical protein